MRCISERDYLTLTVGHIPTASFIRSTANMSGIALRRAKKRHLEILTEWQAKRDAAQDEYARLVEIGEIVVPTHKQQLIQTAQGHPDRDDTQAARRLLDKRGITYEVRMA